jgi:hypothetical protein
VTGRKTFEFIRASGGELSRVFAGLMMSLSGKRKSINAQALRFLIRPTISSQRRRFGFGAPAALQYLSLGSPS